MPSSPKERSLAGRIAAHESWARTPDRSARTAAARAAIDQSFLEEADGDPIRARHLKKAHYARLSLKSAKARREAKNANANSAILDEIADAAERDLGPDAA